MMWHSHAAIGASSAWILLPLLPPDGSLNIAVVMGFCVVGALMPDLDASESKIKHLKVLGIKPFVPLAQVIHREFGHRGFLHSARGWALWTLSQMPLGFVMGWLVMAALSLGYASHLLADACTRSGIPWLYPDLRRVHLLPLKLRVVTGSAMEEVFFVGFACLTLALLFLSIGR